MATVINKTKEILEKLANDHKIEQLTGQQDIERIHRTNEYMRNVRREYHTKDTQSRSSAAATILMSK